MLHLKRFIMNDTINVTIRITGDGYKMVANPITVVLDMDATSNMDATSDGTNGKTRLDKRTRSINKFCQ